MTKAKVISLDGKPIDNEAQLEGIVFPEISQVRERLEGFAELAERLEPDIGSDMKTYLSYTSNLEGEVNRSNKENAGLQKEIGKLNEEIERLKEKAVRDSGTGLYNKGYFKESLESEVKRAERYGCDLSLIILDIDYFKRVNDTYGHLVGDIVLKTMSDTIKTSIRGSDILARYGGEEFAIILPETGLEGAKNLAEKIRGEVEARDFEYNGNKFKITVSLGIGKYSNLNIKGANIEDRANLFAKRADEALYIGKQLGRNQCVISLE